MYYFIKFDNASKSEAYDKGLLFEKLCRELLDSCGYKDIDMRVKANNLEYDIVAKNKVTSLKLVGEAKAWDKKMSSEILTFIAKMIHFWIKEPDTWGIFISISDVTSDVKQQVDDLIEAGYHIRYIIGEDIIESLTSQKNYLDISQIKNLAEKQSDMNVGDTYFLVSDRGYYYIQLLIEKGKTLPTYFTCYDVYGSQITDDEFYKILIDKIDVIKELDKYCGIKNITVEKDIVKETSFLGVMHGEGWFDYQFPANPSKFVGRSSLIKSFDSAIKEVILGKTKTRVIEILSRSGVGKSSISLKLQSIYKEKKYPTVIVDSRNVRTDIDILQVFQQLVDEHNNLSGEKIKLPQNKNEIIDLCNSVDIKLQKQNKTAIIILDQFESIFARPVIYNIIIDLILEFNIKLHNFIFVIARKNDQPTTYDESSEIDLNRLKSISKPIVLQDFKTDEAIELIGHISDELGTDLIKPLKEQVLEISNGFPWLLKKYCAHIIKLVKGGAKQKSIAQTGMQLEDLFNEDILALDETIREFFYRLIAYLPATYSELSEVFQEEDLATKLRVLQNDYRLIRLTGRTYDTYNDILKEYVKTGHVNLTKRYLVRYAPNVVLKLFKNILENGWHSVDDIEKNTNSKHSSIVNMLGELRKLSLLDGTNSKFAINVYANKFYQEDNLVKYLSNILLNNSIVKKIVSEVEKTKKLSLEDVKEILIQEMPFIDATGSIWSQYSKIMCKWLATANLVGMKYEAIYPIAHENEIAINLLNDELFFPTTMISQIEKVLMILDVNKKPMTIQNLKKKMKRSSLNGHLADAYYLGFVKPISRSEYQITSEGESFLKSSLPERREIIKNKTLGLAHIKRYLELVEKNKKDYLEVFMDMLKEFNIDKWNDTSIKWKHKLVRNWLIYCKVITGKTHKNLSI